jgi:hypothetical protein
MKLPSARRRSNPESMTADEELACLLAWAEQQGLNNISAALGRVVVKLRTRSATSKPGRAKLSPP